VHVNRYISCIVRLVVLWKTHLRLCAPTLTNLLLENGLLSWENFLSVTDDGAQMEGT